MTSGAVEERSYVDTDLNQTLVLPGYGDGPNAFPDPGYSAVTFNVAYGTEE